MDGFTAVLPTKFIIIIINTCHSFARARERKRKLLPVVSLFLSLFSRLFVTQDEGRELQNKKSTARVFIFNSDGHFVRAQRTRGARAGR